MAAISGERRINKTLPLRCVRGSVLTAAIVAGIVGCAVNRAALCFAYSNASYFNAEPRKRSASEKGDKAEEHGKHTMTNGVLRAEGFVGAAENGIIYIDNALEADRRNQSIVTVENHLGVGNHILSIVDKFYIISNREYAVDDAAAEAADSAEREADNNCQNCRRSYNDIRNISDPSFHVAHPFRCRFYMKNACSFYLIIL